MKKYFDVNKSALITAILGAFLIGIIIFGLWGYGKYFCEGGKPVKNVPLPSDLKASDFSSACAQGDYINIAINVLTAQ
ncbi:MAG: hypothetical protein HYT08_03680 [Candidatus Levybacteria bacterium]|nr:hypothetical protein [Candidatus Levybacteria bacterium]